MEFRTRSSTDQIIGVIMAITATLGLLGNASALFYFWYRRHKSFPDKLYIAISTFDVLTSLSTIPVILCLFNGRQENLVFKDGVLCTSWSSIASFLVRMSMFMVTVLSLSRGLAIVFPHRVENVRMSLVTWSSVAGYGLLLLSLDGTSFALDWIGASFDSTLPYCSYKFTDSTPKWAEMFILTTLQVELFLPTALIIISFLIVTVSLARKSRDRTLTSNRKKREDRFHQVSVTITLFTALFLLCNTPVFVHQMLILLSYRLISAQNIVTGARLGSYLHLLLSYFPVVLNAALNPCLYLWRMPRYKEEFLRWNRAVAENAGTPLRATIRLLSPQLRREDQDSAIS